MANYITYFNDMQAYEAAELELPNVSYVEEDDIVLWKCEDKNAKKYLTFKALEDGTFTFTPTSSNTLSYSLDNGETWTELNSTTPTIEGGSKVLFKGTCTPLWYSPYGIGTFSSTGQFDIEGNIMSLLFGDNFSGQTSLSGKTYAFYKLFSQCTKLKSAKNLSLPATILSHECYQSMFSGCASLVTAPQLPATALTGNCYDSMFSGCTSLTVAPELPATTLSDSCYQYMFKDCTNLTTVQSILPATTLASNCYNSMFMGCTSLTKAPQLPATTLTSNCYIEMFFGCTSLTKAPELPATTLKPTCYTQMFYNCTNLNYIKCLATDISSTNCTTLWTSGVSANGTFTKAASMESWTSGVNGIPNNWTVQDAE